MAYYAASIDDNDPAFIYSSGWEPVTRDGSWTGTMHSTSVQGSVARVRFTGSRAVAVFTIPTGDGAQSSIASFSIDNGPAVSESHKTTPPVQWNTILWDSGPLPLGNHLLIITNTGDQTYLRLDRIDYDPTAASAAVAPLVSSSTSPAKASTTAVTVVSNAAASNSAASLPLSSLTGSIIANYTGSSLFPSISTKVIIDSGSPTALPISSSTTSGGTSAGDATGGHGASGVTKAATSTGPSAGLIGGILGALLLLLLIALAVGGICLMRRRRRRRHSEYAPGMASRQGEIRPYDLNAREYSSNAQLVSTMGFPPSANTSESTSGTNASHRRFDTGIYVTSHASRDASLDHQRPTYGGGPATDGSPTSAKHAEYMQMRIQEATGANFALAAESGHSSSQQEYYGSEMGNRHLSMMAESAPPPAYQ